MKRTTLPLGLAMACASITHAEFVDVVFEVAPIVETNTPAGWTTWRAIARFTDPTDFVLSVEGSFQHPLEFWTDDPQGLRNLDAGEFGAGTAMEDIALAPLSPAWDSYLSIGATGFAANETQITPAFLGGGPGNVVAGGAFVALDGGWFDSDPNSPELAGPTLGVVLAQFTVKDGFDVHLSGILNGVEHFAGPTGGGEPFSIAFSAQSNATPQCTGDTDGDGVIGFSDIVAVLNAWGPCAGCPEDVNGDNVVGFADLVAVLAAWGSC